MLSNYPPGVTGGELQIAGPDVEMEMYRTCGARWVTTVPRRIVDMMLDNVTVHFDQMTLNDFVSEVRDLRRLMDEAEDEWYCRYEGEVLVTLYRDREWWYCPACGAEHENNYSEQN